MTSTALHRESQQREHLVVKLVVAAPKDDGIALLGRIEHSLYPSVKMRLDADLDIPHAALGKAPVVVFCQSLDTFQTGGAHLLLALISDQQGHHQLAAIGHRIEHQIPALARLLDQRTDDLHTDLQVIITESARGFGLAGEVRLLETDDAICKAIMHATDAE